MSKVEEKNPSTQKIIASDSVEFDEDEKACGVIMPIANTDGYPLGHWDEVKEIIYDAAKLAGYTPKLVSFDNDVGVIQKRIVQNIYLNPIVVCDISSRNANVMFELGMRLAFDKPTIIIKDDLTPYSFDISPIEHLEYPHDLRFQKINAFKEKLKNKISDTMDKYRKDPENFTTFLKHYGTFKVAKLDEKEVGANELALYELKDSIKSLSKMLSAQINLPPKAISSWYKKNQYIESDDYFKFEISLPEEITFEERNSLLQSLKAAGVPVSQMRTRSGVTTLYLHEPMRPEYVDKIQDALDNLDENRRF
ncbi:hypothetical protein [Serratia marcescens]|uniref:hypothetical protein n=1 Tax=Serratia marcescens TaxID=615 RepID=UPI0034E85ADD